MRHRRGKAAPNCNRYKKSLQKQAHKAHAESMPLYIRISGEECEIGKRWDLFKTLIFVPLSKNPGPIVS